MRRQPQVRPRGDYLDGRFVRPRRPDLVIESLDPGDTRDRVGFFPGGGAQAVERAIGAARRAQPAWSCLRPAARAAALRRIGGHLRERGEELARLVTREMGKPLWESRSEVRRMEGRIRITLGEALPDVAPRTFDHPPGRLVYRPIGVVAVLGPFNFPANLVHGQVIPALAAGNTVVVKPSEEVPAVGQTYAEIMDAAGLPPGVFNLVQGGAAVGRALAQHDGVDAVLFTGSWATGRAIARATVGQPGKLLALEMGGKNAAIVLGDADPALAAREIVRSAFATSGQRCSSTSRVLVHRKLAGETIDRIVDLALRVGVGYGFDDDVYMGPLVSEHARRRFLARIAAAERSGIAAPLLPARRLERERPGHYVTPSVHRVLRRDFASDYLGEELFGPNLAIDVVGDLDEAIALANAPAYGLCLSAFTGSRRAFDEVLRRGRAGVINWNRGTIGGSPHMPFGGLGRSGNHRPGGSHTIRSCVFPVAVQEGALDLRAPPPGIPR